MYVYCKTLGLGAHHCKEHTATYRSLLTHPWFPSHGQCVLCSSWLDTTLHTASTNTTALIVLIAVALPLVIMKSAVLNFGIENQLCAIIERLGM